MLRNLFLIPLFFATVGLITGCSDSMPTEAGDEVEQALSKLSPEDQTSARAQKNCPVTDKPLGSMGVPKKVSVNEHDVFICCDGCQESLKESPEKYLKKLGQGKRAPLEVDIAKALDQLPPGDREAARKQKICPVTDKPLGSMGVPKKVSVKGVDVFVCCPGCVDQVKEEADEYLKKLGKDGAKE